MNPRPGEHGGLTGLFSGLLSFSALALTGALSACMMQADAGTEEGFTVLGKEEGVANLALPGVRRHDYASPWTSPGRIDLSAHGDFSALEETAKEAGATVDCLESQGAFLARLGLRLRAERLASSHPAHRGEIMDGADRLLAPHRMGRLFRVLALRGKNGRRNGQ